MNAQLAGAHGYGFRDSFGDDSELESSEAGERHAYAVVGVEAFAFEGIYGDDLVARSVGFDFSSCSFGTPVIFRSGKEPESTVGEDSVYVEDDDFDFLRAGFGHGWVR